MKYINFSKKYRRLFRFNHFNHLFNDNWMVSYKERDALILTLGEETTFYLPQKVFDKNLDEGVEFFSDDKKFRKYIKEYEVFIPALKQSFIDNVKNKEIIDLKSLTKFLVMASGVWHRYYKTEFFYLDKIYKLSDSDPAIKERLMIHYRMKERAKMETLYDVFWGKNCFVNILIKKLSGQFGVSTEDLGNYGVKEIKDLYKNKRVDAEILADRKIARIVAAVNKKVRYVFGEKAKKDILEFKEKTNDIVPYGAKVLKGITANKGKVAGRVKVIISDPKAIDSIRKEFLKMKKGDILVAEITSPEYMPAIRKAGAILADQGGLLSHAAVMSREFSIPSIVGLKYATKIFKDGDLVEVDANKGIVRIINKAK